MTGPDLKPCPFCGEKMPAHDDTSYIRCMGCGAESGWRATPEDVAAAWNRRDPAVLAALPEVQAMIAAAEARGMERAAARARVYASNYEQSSDGRNTFILLAEWADAEAAAILARAAEIERGAK